MSSSSLTFLNLHHELCRWKRLAESFSSKNLTYPLIKQNFSIYQGWRNRHDKESGGENCEKTSAELKILVDLIPSDVRSSAWASALHYHNDMNSPLLHWGLNPGTECQPIRSLHPCIPSFLTCHQTKAWNQAMENETDRNYARDQWGKMESKQNK